MISTRHDIEGKLTIRKYNLDGELIAERVAHNSITKMGRKLVADLFKFNIVDNKEDKIKRISMIHLGKSGEAFDPVQSALLDIVGEIKIASADYVPAADDRVCLRIVGELGTEDCNGALKEAGLFTEDAPPIMYNRVTFDTITKSKEFKLTLIWELTF
jgi:hypothetical protein